MSVKNFSKFHLNFSILVFVAAAIFCPANDLAQAGGAPVAPKVGGREFQMPPGAPDPQMSKEDFEKFVKANLTKTLSPPKTDAAPPTGNRSRGAAIVAPGCGAAPSLVASGFRGRCAVYQFTNYDFPNARNSCGQAAMANALWTLGLDRKFTSDKEFAQNIWTSAPPKITLGNLLQLKDTLGTDWRQINASMDDFGKLYGVKYTWVKGEDEIKKYLSMNLPVLIMLDEGTLKQFGNKWFAGYWVTAFGYDDKNIYVSNFPDNRMSWAELSASFRGNLAQLHGTSGMAMVVWK